MNGVSNNEKSGDSIREDVQEFYGRRIHKASDFQSNVCSIRTDVPKYVKEAIDRVHPEVTERYYGCGMVIPTCLEGTRVLDLGSGAGQDCYVLSQLIGQNGLVTGLDMTEELLAVAGQYLDYHMQQFGFNNPNVEFKKGYIEKMKEVGIKDKFYDVVVSNCVVNLCPDKREVLKEAFRVLKEGGEMFFSDVYADKAVSEAVKKDPNLWGEGISGALPWQELYKIAEEVGFSKPRLVLSRSYYLTNPDPESKKHIGDVKFIAGTYRLFRLPAKEEDACYATYRGGVLCQEDTFTLDANSVFKAGEKTVVDSCVATILKTSRFRDHFDFTPIYKDPMVDPFSCVTACKSKPTSCCK